MTDRCVCCDAVVPDGRIVCRKCELREETQMDETMIAQQLERVDQRCKSNTQIGRDGEAQGRIAVI